MPSSAFELSAVSNARQDRFRFHGIAKTIQLFVFTQFPDGQVHTLALELVYDSDVLRDAIAERCAWANIRAMPNRVEAFPFRPWIYRQCSAVERFFKKLKHFIEVATRYGKRDDNFLASIQLASIRTGLRSHESVTWSLMPFRHHDLSLCFHMMF